MRYAFALLLFGCGDSPAIALVVDASVTPDAAVGIDGGADTSVPKPDCSRAAQARTAPTSLYDAFVKDAATPSRVDKLLADVVAQGGTPLEQGDDRLVFLVRGAPPQGPWSVAGSFTSWKPSPMTLVPGTDLYVLDTHVARGQAEPYKLLSGTADTGFTEDTLARNVIWDGVNHQTVGYFNAIAHPGDQDLAKGRLVRHRSVHATKLGDARDVFVYLPPRYDDGSCDALPHLVVHDGNEDLTRGDFMSVADATYAGTPSASAILAFVALPSQDVRMNQYTFGTQGAVGDDYGDFLLNDLEPMLAGAYRVCPSPVATGQAGASLGGLISTYLAFAHPEHWGYVGAQSASYFWNQNAMITRAGQDPKAAVRFYLDTGCPDDNCDVVRLMNTALMGKAYDVQYVEEPGAQHDWSYWAGRLPKLLLRFREGTTTCQ